MLRVCVGAHESERENLLAEKEGNLLGNSFNLWLSSANPTAFRCSTMKENEKKSNNLQNAFMKK